MAEMGCEEQRVPLAPSENGEVTDAPLAGVETTTLVGVVEEGASAGAGLTVMVTLVTQDAP